MRNSQRTDSIAWIVLFAFIIIAVGLAASGCASDKDARENLSAGWGTINSRPQGDELTDALNRADTQLAKSSSGQTRAEALYLRGRALEQRVKQSDQQAAGDFAAARNAYIEALAQQPSDDLDRSIRTSLANVCYWQDDYANAQQQWTATYGKFEDDSVNAFILYRIGLCQQRLGNFPVADQTFAMVQQKHPNTDAADRARQRSGHRAFFVQLATFANPQGADAAMQQLMREGVSPNRALDARNRSVITIGPASNYAQAVQLKARFASRYPDALIVP